MRDMVVVVQLQLYALVDYSSLIALQSQHQTPLLYRSKRKTYIIAGLPIVLPLGNHYFIPCRKAGIDRT